MAYIDFQRFFVRFKIVFYGPGLSGKSSNLQALHELTQEPLELVMLDRDDDSGITCDYMPLKLGQLRGIDTVFKLYSVPGQVRYARARRMVLKDVDGIVFVADSQGAAMNDNVESLEELRRYLKEENISLDDVPIVFQYNKRDLDDIAPVDALNEKLNPSDHSWIPAAAVRRENVKETLTMIAKLVFTKAAERYDLIPTKPDDLASEARGGLTGGISRPGQPAVSMGAPSIEVGPLLPPLSDLPEDEIAAAIPSEADGVQFPITRPPAAMRESTGRQVSETVVYLMEERILCRLDDMEAMLQSVFTRVTSLDGEGVAAMLARIEESGLSSGGGADEAGLAELKDSIQRLRGTVESSQLGGASFSDDPMLDVLEQMKNAIGQMSQADNAATLEEANARMRQIETILQEHMVRSQEGERRLQDLVAQLGYSSVVPDDPAAYADVPAEMSEGIAESLAAIERKANERGELDIQQAVAALRAQLDQSHQLVATRASLQPPIPVDDAADLQLEQRQIAETVNEIREIVGGVSVELDRVRRTYRSLRQDIQKDIKSQIEDQLASYLREMDQGPRIGPRDTGSPGSYSMNPERRK